MCSSPVLTSPNAATTEPTTVVEHVPGAPGTDPAQPLESAPAPTTGAPSIEEALTGAQGQHETVIPGLIEQLRAIAASLEPNWPWEILLVVVPVLVALWVTKLAAEHGGRAGFKAAQAEAIRMAVEDELRVLNIAVGYIMSTLSHCQTFAHHWKLRYETWERNKKPIQELLQRTPSNGPMPAPPSFQPDEFQFDDILLHELPLLSLEKYIIERTTVRPWGVDAALRATYAEHQIRDLAGKLNNFYDCLRRSAASGQMEAVLDAYANGKLHGDYMNGLNTALNNLMFFMVQLEKAIWQRTYDLGTAHPGILGTGLTYGGSIDTSPVKRLISVKPNHRAWLVSWGLDKYQQPPRPSR